MNKELERLKDYITSRPVVRCERSALEEHRYVEIDTIAITQILNYINNSISKEVIVNIIKELECDNHNKENKIIKQEKFLQMSAEVIQNSILKQKIQDKIAEIKANKNHKYTVGTVVAIINELQELLEEK